MSLAQLVRGTPTPADRPVKASAKLALPRLNLADYITAEATPPLTVTRAATAPVLRDSLGNTDWGDCGDAMAIHGIAAFHEFAGTPVPPFVTQDALTLYGEVSGFDINAGPSGSNPTDTGTDNQQLVDAWRNVGVLCAADGSRHKIAGSLFVDPRDQRVTRIGIYEFLVVFRALALPQAAQGRTIWNLNTPPLQGDASPGSWGYHDVPYLGYDQHYIRCDTWGEDKLIGWGFDHRYAVQGFVVVTEEMLTLEGVSPSGVNWTQLNQDLANFPAISH